MAPPKDEKVKTVAPTAKVAPKTSAPKKTEAPKTVAPKKKEVPKKVAPKKRVVPKKRIEKKRIAIAKAKAKGEEIKKVKTVKVKKSEPKSDAVKKSGTKSGAVKKSDPKSAVKKRRAGRKSVTKNENVKIKLTAGKIKYRVERLKIIRKIVTHKKYKKPVKKVKKVVKKKKVKKPDGWLLASNEADLTKKQKRALMLAKKMYEKRIAARKAGKPLRRRKRKIPPKKAKSVKFYPAEAKPKKVIKKKAIKKPLLKKTLKPGTVCIVLTGQHKCKRVIFLKQLDSGLCLVTGPHHLNKCPLRRYNQIYLIGTQTRVKLTDVELPKNLNDDFFKRTKLKKAKSKKEEGDIFTSKKQKYRPSKERKLTQKTVDKMVLKALRKSKDKKAISSYLMHKFTLNGLRAPHLIKY